MLAEIMTSGRTTVVSIATLIPSTVFAVINADSISVVAGVAIGTLAGWWAIYSAISEQQSKRAEKRLQETEARLENWQKVAITAQEENARLKVQNAELDEQLDLQHENPENKA